MNEVVISCRIYIENDDIYNLVPTKIEIIMNEYEKNNSH